MPYRNQLENQLECGGQRVGRIAMELGNLGVFYGRYKDILGATVPEGLYKALKGIIRPLGAL